MAPPDHRIIASSHLLNRRHLSLVLRNPNQGESAQIVASVRGDHNRHLGDAAGALLCARSAHSLGL
jgi:hypothetical protein